MSISESGSQRQVIPELYPSWFPSVVTWTFSLRAQNVWSVSVNGQLVLNSLPSMIIILKVNPAFWGQQHGSVGKALATKPDNMSSISTTPMVERQNQLHGTHTLKINK